ncbi:rhodanese-like domain-containing protein, partial [Duganella callida]
QAVRHAFSARASAPPAVRAIAGAQTLLCPTRDEHNQFCTALHAGAAVAGGDPQLDSAALDAFLLTHPAARLIDVREPYEFAATLGQAPAGRVLSVPMSRLAEHAASWLREAGAGAAAPLVFFCRSGNRSLKAAHCLRRLGHPHVYSLRGGLALASPASQAMALAA